MIHYGWKVMRMDLLRQLNAAIDYIEANLCGEIDLHVAAAIACVTEDSFARFFSYMTGMSLAEYVRRRRITLAARDLRDGKTPIVEIAVKYGYDSAAAFSRAFARQHGMTPSAWRREGGSLRVYPPVSFHITIKGAREMELRMIEREETVVYGVWEQYEGQGYRSREELRHRMWAEECENVPGRLCEGRWNQPGSTAYDGAWYGIWRDGKYMIARERVAGREQSLTRSAIPAGAYAAFQTARGGLAWEELPKLYEQIFDAWLPSSGFRQRDDYVIEVLHLWTDSDQRRKNRYCEVWVPVEQAQGTSPARSGTTPAGRGKTVEQPAAERKDGET